MNALLGCDYALQISVDMIKKLKEGNMDSIKCS